MSTRSIPYVLGLLTLSTTLSVGCSDDAPATPADASTADVSPTDANTADVARDTASTDASTADASSDVTSVDASADVSTDASIDAAPDAARDASTDSATDASTDASAPTCVRTRAFVTTSNYMVGGYAIGPFATPSLMVSSAMAPDQDHVPVESGCQVFTLLRGNDALAVLDPSNLPTIARTIPLRTVMGDAGAGSYLVNPYDVEALSATKAYVSQYALSRIAIVDPSRSGAAAVTGSIDLSPVRAGADNDSSGSPEATEMFRVGDRVFVVMQNLASYAPAAAGSVAVIDTRTDTLVDVDPATAGTQAAQLTHRNPVGAVLTPGGRLVTACVGVQPFMPPNNLDGAVTALDTTTLRPVGMPVTETALNGDLQGLVMLDESRGWAVVYRLAAGGARTAHVVAFDLATGTAGATIFSAGDIGGLRVDPSGNVWLLDRTTGAAGVRVFRPDGTQITTAPIATTLPPYGVAFVP